MDVVLFRFNLSWRVLWRFQGTEKKKQKNVAREMS